MNIIESKQGNVTILAAQGKLALANPSVQVQQIFDIAGFESILPIFKTVNEAVAACAM